jgi:hypothetical protein
MAFLNKEPMGNGIYIKFLNARSEFVIGLYLSQLPKPKDDDLWNIVTVDR